ncbi:MAG: glycosyltransferase [Burkholderiaceae bacterium]|nr:glycosyltransferase [Burkholderiaceae bacterium]
MAAPDALVPEPLQSADGSLLLTQEPDLTDSSPLEVPSKAVRPGASFTGNLDLCGPRYVEGWLHDAAAPLQRLEFQIIADGVVHAQGVADKFRKDLKESGLGDGICGFSLLLPASLIDGATHQVEVREASTGYLLPGSPRTLETSLADLGEAGLDGTTLRGWGRLNSNDAIVDELLLIESGKVLGEGKGWFDSGKPGIVQFQLPLPMAVFDGRAHGFEVRTKFGMVRVGACALITPFRMTPEDALLRYAREGMRPALSSLAGFRYEALAQSLKAIAAVPVHGKFDAARLQATVAQLQLAHSLLVRGPSEKDKHFVPLVFTEHNAPKVSIVIPVHNKFYVTYHCLLSLLVAHNQVSFEVIVVDDGSKDQSIQLPQLVQGITCLRNEEAQGFILSCNRGGQAARGEYIVMLNNDTEVTAGWLDELLGAFEHFDGVGMAGAKLLYPNGQLQEAGGVVWNTGNPWNYGRQANPHDPRFGYARQTDYLSGACVMLPKKLWDDIGGFSETYVPAYFEDTDLAFQVRDRGYKTVYVPFAQVIHYEGMSNGTSTSEGIKRFQEINRPKFKQRWAGACRNNGKEGVDLEFNKDRNVEFRVLVIDAETPMPDQNAGSYAAVQEMRLLQALGFKCTFVPMNMAYMGGYTEQLQRMGIECLYSPFANNVNQLIEQRGREFDVVYITRYYVANQCLAHIRQHAPQAKVVLMNADLHFLRELRAALHHKSAEALDKATATRDEELAVMRQVDLVLSYTDVEKAVILSHNLSATKVAKCPWICETTPNVPTFEARKDIAFLGGYNHAPNAEAVEWFVHHVMPLLRDMNLNITLRLYGSNASAKLQELTERHPDVCLEGWVANVADVYDTCRVFLAPLQSGAGIKGKVIGALAHGVPTVLSGVAAEGIPVGDGIEAAVANKPAEWAQRIKLLYTDNFAWEKMSAHAQAYARRHYGFEKALADMQAALQEAEIYTTTTKLTLAYH